MEDQIRIMLQLFNYVDYYNKTEKPLAFYRAVFENKVFAIRSEDEYISTLKYIIKNFEGIRELSEEEIYRFAEYIDFLSLNITNPKVEMFKSRDSLIEYWDRKECWLYNEK